MKTTTLSAAIFAALSMAAAPTQAATAIGNYLTFSGFGTLGYVQTNSDEGKFGRDNQPGGADKTASFDVDSNLGLQLTGKATNWLSATVQMLAAKRKENYIEADIEWAYVLVKPLDGLAIRAGRMATPTFAISDSRNIGYANTWLRAPNEVYALNAFPTVTGVDASYRLPVGPVSFNLALLAGKTDFVISGTDATGKNLTGVNLFIETDWVTFRVGQVKADVDVPMFNVVADPYSFSGIGAMVDHNNIVAQAEYVKREAGNGATKRIVQGWYVMDGYRIDKFLPYFIISGTTPKASANSFAILSKQKTTAVGMRWDAFKSAAVKFQIDHIDTSDTGGVSFTIPQPPAPPGTRPPPAALSKPVTAVSLALDFTF